jgi:tetratricopeptide (TPR) repeat protein
VLRRGRSGLDTALDCPRRLSNLKHTPESLRKGAFSCHPLHEFVSRLAVLPARAEAAPERWLLPEGTPNCTGKLSPDHPDTLRSMNNLAGSYLAAGRTQEAVKLYEETLQLIKAKLGPDHPDTLTSMNNLAGSYLAGGRTQQALKVYEETLQLRKASLGPDHPDTLVTMNNLATSYFDAGRTQDALKLHDETLQLRKARLGLDHPDTLMNEQPGQFLLRRRPHPGGP